MPTPIEEKKTELTDGDVEDFDIRLNDGTLYRIRCTDSEFNRILGLIGEDNIADVQD